MKHLRLVGSILFFATIVLIGAALVMSTRADFAPSLPVPTASKGLLLYSAGGERSFAVGSSRLSDAAPQVISDFGNGKFANYDKELFLSPDRNFVAITINPIFGEGDSRTYISTIDGQQVVEPHLGSFVSWAPDSSKALLYVSTMEAPWDRYIYALDTQGKYYNTGLPNGTISADISATDGSIVYSLTRGGTDDSTIYVRDPQGSDKLLLRGDGNVFAWVRFSPKGDRVSFMKSNVAIDGSDLSVWDMNPDGSGAEKISAVGWNYPAVWSPDGTRISFSNAGDVWEYDTTGKSLNNVTNSNKGAARPSYSADGKTIVFESSASGEKQIWAAQSGVVTQLTTGGQEKSYPILP